MYICICNAITERQVKEAVSNGATSISDLQGQLGVASCCGACADTAIEYLPGGQYAGQSSMFATQVTRTAETAANDTDASPVRMPSYASLA
ncbi:(2Fe-2S)-binding protein [Paenalcaligenes niemegkensis]|uniref:(2Fe-2S)-binding protein n=1 Tax=Paenalcaligenes niemegkensis TaxID=2895469 RepID=UPI001EE8FC19|nr:(2Fe-2S)-binding protein [Paenalcaligenes niemegkensis]MCQ9618027.1 (2Fe-2S)-binding protein [Paenalcaligenes niemegkensis]